uniref:Pentatricopeptide repeat-containing protein n=1 Tax=Steinernema glaseri TaxID=37863 RepID=A0A1I8AI40_9BILA
MDLIIYTPSLSTLGTSPPLSASKLRSSLQNHTKPFPSPGSPSPSTTSGSPSTSACFQFPRFATYSSPKISFRRPPLPARAKTNRTPKLDNSKSVFAATTSFLRGRSPTLSPRPALVGPRILRGTPCLHSTAFVSGNVLNGYFIIGKVAGRGAPRLTPLEASWPEEECKHVFNV